MTAPDVAVCRGGTVGGADPTAVQVACGPVHGRHAEAASAPDESGGLGGLGGLGGRRTDDDGVALAYTTEETTAGSRGTISFYVGRTHPAVRMDAVVAG